MNRKKKTATTVQSRKAKGRRLQQLVSTAILATLPTLQPDDVRSTSMGSQGVDVQLSPEAHRQFPFSIECKNQERVNLWQCIEQAESNTADNSQPLLVIKRNGSDPYAIVRLGSFLGLVTSGSVRQ